MTLYPFRGDYIVLDKVPHNGHIHAKFPGFHRVYVGYTKKDALRDFKRVIKGGR